MPSRRDGSITRRGDRKFLIRWFEGEDGRGRKYGSRTIHGTKKDAESALRKALAQRDQGIDARAGGETVGSLLDKWLKHTAPHKRRARTVAEYGEVADRYIRPGLGKARLDRLKLVDVQALVSGLSDGSLVPSGRPLAPQSVRFAHAVLSAALKYAVRSALIPSNPAAGVDLPRRRTREMQALTPAQVDRLRAEIAGTRHEVLFLLLLSTGLRPSEALALDWKSIDFERARLNVRRTLSRRIGVKGERRDLLAEPPVFEDPKRRASARTVPLPPTLVAALRAHRTKQNEQRLKVGGAYEDSGLVFSNEIGRPLDLRNVTNRHFKPALDRAGISKTFRLYDLRHSFATLSLAGGVHHRVVTERLGHASAKMTLDVYSHVIEPMQEEATARVEALIFGAPEKATH